MLRQGLVKIALILKDVFMTSFIRACLAIVFSMLLGSAVFGQESAPDLTVNEIAGHWRIEVIDRPNHSFKGTAIIPRVMNEEADKSVLAETITEDKCCNGNHARVLQDSQITIEDREIIVESKIVKYLLRVEPVKASYSPDDFRLTRLNANTLVGTANGYLPVRWVRDELNIS